MIIKKTQFQNTVSNSKLSLKNSVKDSLIKLKFEFLIFLLLAILATYPLILDFDTFVYSGGRLESDLNAGLHYFWTVEYSWIGGHNSTELTSYPFGGLDIEKIMVMTPKMWGMGIPIIGYFTNIISSYNIFIFMGFILSAVGAYQLTFFLTKNRYGSFIAGTIFAFAPFHLSHAHHLNVFSIQWIPFFVLYLFKLKDDTSYKNGFLCSIFFSLIFLNEFYYPIFMSIYLACFIIAVLISKYGIKSFTELSTIKNILKSNSFKVIVASFLFACLIFIATNYTLISMIISPLFSHDVSIKSSGLMSQRQQFTALYDFVVHAAHWWNFVLPSNEHPIFGKYTLDFIKTNMPGFQTGEETNLYIGYTSLLLSLYAIRKRKDFPVRFLVAIAIVAFLFSTGAFMQYIPFYGIPIPYILVIPMIYAFYNKMNKLGWFFLIASVIAASLPFWLYTIIPSLSIMNTFQVLPIPMPAILIFLITPMIRVMARFDIIIMLSISVLAGIGVSILLEKIKSNKKQILIVSMIILLIGFEYTNIPPWRSTDIGEVPEVYTWLASQPKDIIIVEYPFDSISYFFYQRIHEKRMINGGAFETVKLAPSVTHLTNPGVPGMLRYLGADYIIFHENNFVEQYGKMPDLNKTPGLLLIKKFENISVYRITAEPAWIEPVVYDAGFSPPEIRPSGHIGRWMINNGTVTLINYSPEKRVVNINFTAVSFGKERTLEIMLNNKNVETIDLTNIRKGYTLKDMELSPGNNTLVFHSIQEPVTVDSVVHNGDMRKYSADFTNIVLEYR